ncbi:KSR1 Kinase, partial [Dicaeum eximium]|nr:KSR1 Kinase [Dicaeum eximium]
IPEELTLDALLEMNESKVKETMKRCGARDEECSRLNGALSCLRKVTGTACLELKDDVPLALPERRDSSCSQPDPAWSPCAPAKAGQHQHQQQHQQQHQPRSVSASTAPPCEPPAPSHGPCSSAEILLEPPGLPAAGGRPRTPHSITVTPPATPQPKRRHRLKPPRTPPPPCRKVFQLLP